MIGRPVISSWSFANAIREPEKLTAPMTHASSVGSSVSSGISPASGISSWYSDSATAATAPPPTPLNRATICGIAVIFTARAETTPITVPSAMPRMIRPKFSISGSSSVATTAINIPIAASTLPRRAVRGWLSPLMPRMNRTDATR